MKISNQFNELVLKKIGFKYKQKLVLSNVDTSFNKHEITGVFGKNGAGKTTLFRCISGQIAPFSGEVLKNELSLSLMPDYFFLWGKLRINEIVEFLTSKNFDNEWTDYLETYLNINEFNNVFFEHLSLGQKKRVQLFFCLMNKPDFILLDEPLSGLDPSQRENILSFIQCLKSEMGVILSSHEYSAFKNILDKILVIKSHNVYQIPNKPQDILSEI